MVGEAHGQTLEATLSQQLMAIQELNDKIAQLGKRNKPQGRRPQHGERRFGDAPEAGYVEPKPPDLSWITSHHTSSTYKYLTHSYLYFKSVNEVKIYSFSGSSWPDDYLSWERTMDDWFSYQGVPKKERLAHAIKQLSRKAYSWWKRVDKTHGKSPEEVVTNWKDLKDVMIRKYVTTLPTQETRRKYPRRFSNGVSKEAKKVVPQQGHRSLIYQDQIRPSQIPTVLYDKYQPYEVPKSMEKNLFSPDTLARYKEKSDKPILQGKAKVSPILDKFVYKSSPTGMSHLSLSKNVKTGPEVQKDTNSTSLLESKAVHDLRNKEMPSPKKEETTSQCKSSNSENLKDQTCYRCHKRGHFAVVCPSKQVLTETSLEKKTDLSIKSDSFIQSNLLAQNSCMMHLSLSKGDVTGTKEHEFKGEEPPGATPVMDQKMVQDTMQSMLLKEAKPVNEVSYQGKCLTPPRDTSTDVCVLDVGSKNESYLLTEVPQKEPDHKLSHEPPQKWKPKSKQWIVQIPKPMVRFILDQHVFNISMIDIMQLLFVQSVETISGCQEESFKDIPPDNLMLLGESTPRKNRNVATKTLKDHQFQKRCNGHNLSRGVILSNLFKEEPPDAPCITKPKLYQGKVLNSQKRMKPDLLYRDAGYIVSRSKHCQEGGDDVVIRSATEPEVNPNPYSTSQGANQDIRALNMPYLTNQEGLNHEDNFYGFYTQERVQANWNWAKIFTAQEVMNFTTQRFLSPSICEYPTLEGDLSSSKEPTEAKPVITFKSILSDFQKAKDQEKWTRKSEDMFNLQEPVKPMLHSPQLEANRFNQLQTRNWRPGDHFNQSGGIPEVLSCTRTQEISRFNGESL
ncbi:uncharacterized protein LOC117130034 [Brassica rapa]|uniref:uncharacterized protein LOC117130034 n=1 Tax=Brassica campestris TaxID=3711 RepID=UPI00142E1CB0|nr:uncharacterized protein LOC117130034 [Brassica rapa]